ncbi:hypothetical protein PSD17_55430 [Pseudonocardia sp. D17]|nr:hypothetical protein PSD17_55430 [Pseudonocardia sp. D17]
MPAYKHPEAGTVVETDGPAPDGFEPTDDLDYGTPAEGSDDGAGADDGRGDGAAAAADDGRDAVRQRAARPRRGKAAGSAAGSADKG